MMRVCSLNTCPVGIATQDPRLRARFSGKPEYVVNFMMFVAQELREYMAQLGIRTVEELVGRSDLLQVREHLVTHRAETLDLSSILSNPWGGSVPHFDPADVYDFKLEKTADMDERRIRENCRVYVQTIKTAFGGNAEPLYASKAASFRRMVELGEKYGARWLRAGNCSKKGHPHHPLYLRKDEKTVDFDVNGYLDSLERK